MITVGLLGCGNIGHVIAKSQENFKITAVYDVVFERAEEFGREFWATPYSDFSAFLKESTDIVVEAASVAADMISDLRKNSGIAPKAIGISTAGPVDLKTGSIVCSPNMKCERIFLSGPLEKRFGIPVRMMTDCKAGVLG